MSKQKITVGVVGVSGRGQGLLEYAICQRADVTVAAVCDLYADRAEAAADLVEKLDGKRPETTTDYHDILKMDSVDAVIIAAAWEAHIPVAVDAMRAGKIVGCEVGGAYSVDDCWQLVRTQEETGVPCMLLENCCFGQRELMVLHMVHQGLFGEVVHCAGGYHHDLREEIAFGAENRHYRLRNYLNRNCENYPTHELGPIAKVLNINRGNRMVSLTSVASCAKGLNAYAAQKRGANDPLATAKFAQGDVVSTIIRCAHGETIALTLDTTLPRFYSRGFEVHGTKGLYTEWNDSLLLDGVNNKEEFGWHKNWGNAEQFAEQYDHPMWKRFASDGVRGGHGGMDGLEFDAFFAAIREDKPMPVDVYDMAAWMSITALSEESIAMGGLPVAIPDFTNGKWTHREAEPEWGYALSR